MRPVGIVFGILLALTGMVWIGQGLGYIKGSFMTGSSLWLWIGVACLVVGSALVAGAARLGRRRR